MRELWGDEPPLSALTTLQTYVLHLRKLIGRGVGLAPTDVAKEILVTRDNGYEFRTGPTDDLDLHRYQSSVLAARSALAHGNTAEAAQLFRTALQIWEGPPLADVRAGRLLERRIAQLEESRLTALEYRIEADLRLGNHRDVISELTALIGEYPLHEDLHAQYMLALHLAGRRSQALLAFHDLRRMLIEDVSLEPSPRLQRLQQAILCSDPSLEQSLVGEGLVFDRMLPTRPG